MNVAASSNANKRLEASKIMELCNSLKNHLHGIHIHKYSI